MNTFVIEEFERFKKVTFYTVRWDEAELSETDKFIAKYRSSTTSRNDLDEILTLILEIGEYRGASDIYFRRHAGKAKQKSYLHSQLLKFITFITTLDYFALRSPITLLYCSMVVENHRKQHKKALS